MEEENGNIWNFKGSYYWRYRHFSRKTMMNWKGPGIGYLKSLTSMRSDEDDVIEHQNEGGVYRREDHDHDDDDDDGEICGYSNYHYK